MGRLDDIQTYMIQHSTHIWLLIGTSFASLTRNFIDVLIYVVLIILYERNAACSKEREMEHFCIFFEISRKVRFFFSFLIIQLNFKALHIDDVCYDQFHKNFDVEFLCLNQQICAEGYLKPASPCFCYFLKLKEIQILYLNKM